MMPDYMIPQTPPPITKEAVKSTLEILPGLVVQPRWINGNWFLIPVGADDQLPDVERMVIEDLAKEIKSGELTPGDKCCIIEALANRRRANIDALRNVMGLLGTDKPMPLTEVPPLAMVEGDDLVLNELPTAESTGNPIFDYIEYSYTCFQDGVWELPVRHSIAELGHDWETFRIGDRLRVWLIRQDTHEIASPKWEIELQHLLWRENQCWPEDQWMIWTKFGDPPHSYLHMNRTGHIGPVYPGGCGHLPSIFKHPTRPQDVPWPGDDSVALEISVRDEVSPRGPWRGPPENRYYVHIEHIDKSKRKYGVELTIRYYNHDIGVEVTEIRIYAQSYGDQALMQFVRSEEVKVLDEMRVQGLINGPQWIKGKAILDGYAEGPPVCPPPTFIQIPPIPSPPEPYPPPVLPPIEFPPEIPPIILPPPPPPPEPPIFLPPIFPNPTCKPYCPYDELLEELFG